MMSRIMTLAMQVHGVKAMELGSELVWSCLDWCIMVRMRMHLRNFIVRHLYAQKRLVRQVRTCTHSRTPCRRCDGGKWVHVHSLKQQSLQQTTCVLLQCVHVCSAELPQRDKIEWRYQNAVVLERGKRHTVVEKQLKLCAICWFVTTAWSTASMTQHKHITPSCCLSSAKHALALPSRLELNGHGPLQDRDSPCACWVESRSHATGKIQNNIFTQEGVVDDRHWWIICQGVGGSCSFIKPYQEYLGTASPFNLTLLSLLIVAHMIIATHVHWHIREQDGQFHEHWNLTHQPSMHWCFSLCWCMDNQVHKHSFPPI